MEQTTDAEKAMAVAEFLDFKRKNKVGSGLLLVSVSLAISLVHC